MTKSCVVVVPSQRRVDGMNVPSENLDKSQPLSDELSETEIVHSSSREKENVNDLRSRLLKLILESEQERKSQA